MEDGVKFSVNVSGKNVPTWVYEDVAGEDGKINVTVNRYQTRDLKGNVNNDHLVELLGEKGRIRAHRRKVGQWLISTTTVFFHPRLFTSISVLF